VVNWAAWAGAVISKPKVASKGRHALRQFKLMFEVPDAVLGPSHCPEAHPPATASLYFLPQKRPGGRADTGSSSQPGLLPWDCRASEIGLRQRAAACAARWGGPWAALTRVVNR